MDELPTNMIAPRPVDDLPPKLEALVAGGLVAFIALLVVAFMGHGMALPGLFILLIVAILGALPMIWGRIMPTERRPHDHMWQFMKGGVRVHTGRLSAQAALAQLLVLPALILVLAAAFVVIAELT